MTKKKSGNPFNKNKYPNCHEGHQYALDVVNGKILANQYIIGACNRYLIDIELALSKDKSCSFYFLPEKAERYLTLVQKFHHIKGRWNDPRIIYMPWQKWLFMNVMGFYSKKTGERRFRTAHIDMARGQGKSTMASQMVLYFLALDNPKGNEIYTAATKKEQARLVLDAARAMAAKNTKFLRATGVKVRAHEIIHPKSFSFVRALAANDKSADGLAAVLIVTDELHAMAKPMFDVLDSGMSKRTDSLLLSITTAGTSLETAGYSQRRYAQSVALGKVKDDTFFSAVYQIEDNEDEKKEWHKEELWIKANPGLGEIVDLDNLRAKAHKAQHNPVDRPNFLCKHLNLYQTSFHQFYSIDKWKKLHDKTLSINNLIGKPCYAACDLSSKNDITSFSYIFRIDGKYIIHNVNFIPEEAVNEHYQQFIDEGSLIPTRGGAINYDVLKAHLIEYSKMFDIRAVHYDSWQANQFALEMQGEGVEMLEFRMTTSNLSEPTKYLDAIIRDEKVKHFGTKIMEWFLANVVCKYDAANNVFPRKEHEKQKIDGAIATIMALAGWMNEVEDVKRSIYEDREIVIL